MSKLERIGVEERAFVVASDIGKIMQILLHQKMKQRRYFGYRCNVRFTIAHSANHPSHCVVARESAMASKIPKYIYLFE